MARKRNVEDLTLDQISCIRATQGKRLTGILTRLSKNAEGTLTDNDGNKIEMTAGQIKSAQIIKDCVLPQQQATTFEDVTEPEETREDIDGDVQAELMKALKEIQPEERQALIDSIGQQKQ